MIKWNLDQAWAWFVLRDDKIVEIFADDTITAHNWYKPDNERLTVENGNDFCIALAKGKVTAWIGKNTIPSEDWRHYKIETFAMRRSWVSDGVENIEGITFFADEMKRKFPKEPVTKDFSAPKSSKVHEEAYEAYLKEKIEIYLQDKNLKKPWKPWDKEETVLKKRMGLGYDRTKFKNARKTILQKFPCWDQKNLSRSKCSELRQFLTKFSVSN